jgi:ABC-type nitrate/sulfonate/bicarbonate transport system substrate-binding protein
MVSPVRKARMTQKVEPPPTKSKLALLRRLIVGASLVLAASHPAAALDAVSMQLKWKHQFQFAGYYQAFEQGFYRDAGLDVTIREGGPGIDVAEMVAGGKAEFGVCSASVLREWTTGRRLVVLAAIFQHSPAVILVPRRADISSVSDLRGRTLMDSPGSDEIAAMLKREGIDYQSMLRVPHEGNPRDLLAGRADAMIAYSTNEPFVLEQLGAAYRTFAPAASGIDFYGDNLCTSETELKAHPDRVAAFRAASVKGWAYALAHKEATVDLILRSYSAKKKAVRPWFLRRSIPRHWSGATTPGSASRIPRVGDASPRPIANSGC